MTLLNYSHCGCCKKQMNKNKLTLQTLHQLFPVNVCNRICDFNIHCKYCNMLMESSMNFQN